MDVGFGGSAWKRRPTEVAVQVVRGGIRKSGGVPSSTGWGKGQWEEKRE